jgi:high-affinity iron transporter
MRQIAFLLLTLGSLALAACGSGGDSTQATVSAASARQDVADTRKALNAALATYKSGDRKAANEQVAEAYVSHFEDVEAPLEAKNEQLKERIEHAIADDLRTSMKAGKPASEIQAQVKAIMADLDKAEAALQ